MKWCSTQPWQKTTTKNNQKQEKKLQQQTNVNPINLSSWEQELDFLDIKTIFPPLRIRNYRDCPKYTKEEAKISTKL